MAAQPSVYPLIRFHTSRACVHRIIQWMTHAGDSSLCLKGGPDYLNASFAGYARPMTEFSDRPAFPASTYRLTYCRDPGRTGIRGMRCGLRGRGLIGMRSRMVFRAYLCNGDRHRTDNDSSRRSAEIYA